MKTPCNPSAGPITQRPMMSWAESPPLLGRHTRELGPPLPIHAGVIPLLEPVAMVNHGVDLAPLDRHLTSSG